MAKKLGEETIVLVGMMGVGKSALGRVLARGLGLPFCDSDAAIEDAAQMSIADIFAQHGEAYFRDGERRVIARLLGEPPCVLAIGGGAFEDSATRALIAKHALSIWIDVPLDDLAARVSAQPKKRPMLGDDPTAIKTRLAELLAARAPTYAKADLKITLENQSLQKSGAKLLQVVQDYYK